MGEARVADDWAGKRRNVGRLAVVISDKRLEPRYFDVERSQAPTIAVDRPPRMWLVSIDRIEIARARYRFSATCAYADRTPGDEGKAGFVMGVDVVGKVRELSAQQLGSAEIIGAPDLRTDVAKASRHGSRISPANRIRHCASYPLKSGTGRTGRLSNLARCWRRRSRSRRRSSSLM